MSGLSNNNTNINNQHTNNENNTIEAIPSIENDDQSQILQDNWYHGRFKRLTIPSVSSSSSGMVTDLQFDDDKIIASMDDGGIYIYETKTGKHISTLTGHEGGIWTFDYIGNTLVSGSTDHTVRVWDIKRAVCTHVFRGHTSTIRCLKIIMPTMVDDDQVPQPSQPVIVSASRDSTLRVWRLPDISTTEDISPPFDDEANPWHIHTLKGHDLSVRTFASHGNNLISGSYDQTMIVWNLETGQLVHHLKANNGKVYVVKMDPERKQCYSGNFGDSIGVWNYVTGECLYTLKGHDILVGLLGLTTNDLISASADSTLRIWDPVTGECRHVLSGHNNAITCFYNDENKIISGAEGGLKMWDIKTGQYIKDLLPVHVDTVWKVVFNKNRCVAAVYLHTDDESVTYFEVLDFSVKYSPPQKGGVSQILQTFCRGLYMVYKNRE